MRKFLLFIATLVVFNIAAQACEGDCVVCHPNLVKEDGKLDKDHEILLSCKTCHTQEEMEKIDMGSGCGQDCWDCHDIKKVTASNVAEHQGLQKCIDCHVTIDKSILGGSSAPAFSELPSLDDLMSQSIEVGLIDENSSEIVEEMIMVEEVQETKATSNKVNNTIWDAISDFFSSLWKNIISIFA